MLDSAAKSMKKTFEWQKRNCRWSVLLGVKYCKNSIIEIAKRTCIKNGVPDEEGRKPNVCDNGRNTLKPETETQRFYFSIHLQRGRLFPARRGFLKSQNCLFKQKFGL